MKTYIMIHSHKHGISVFPFQSKDEYSGWHEDENSDLAEFQHIYDAVEANVEQGKGEFVEFIEIDVVNIPTV